MLGGALLETVAAADAGTLPRPAAGGGRAVDGLGEEPARVGGVVGGGGGGGEYGDDDDELPEEGAWEIDAAGLAEHVQVCAPRWALRSHFVGSVTVVVVWLALCPWHPAGDRCYPAGDRCYPADGCFVGDLDRGRKLRGRPLVPSARAACSLPRVRASSSPSRSDVRPTVPSSAARGDLSLRPNPERARAQARLDIAAAIAAGRKPPPMPLGFSSNPQMGEAAALAIGDCVRDNSTLARLDLAGCAGIGDAGVGAILARLERNNALRTLTAAGCGVAEAERGADATARLTGGAPRTPSRTGAPSSVGPPKPKLDGRSVAVRALKETLKTNYTLTEVGLPLFGPPLCMPRCVVRVALPSGEEGSFPFSLFPFFRRSPNPGLPARASTHAARAAPSLCRCRPPRRCASSARRRSGAPPSPTRASCSSWRPS